MRNVLWPILGLILVACGPRQLPEEQRAYYDAVLQDHPAQPHQITQPSAEQPMPWAVGQWVLSKTTDRRGRVSVERMSIVAQDECGWWVEMMSMDERQRSLSKICYTEMPHADHDLEDATRRATEIVQVIISQTGDQEPSVLDLRGPEGDLMRQMAGGAMADAAGHLHWEVTDDREDLTVQAGTFAGTMRSEFDIRLALIRFQGTSWVHSEVPVHGGVRSERDNGAVTELIDFGLTGAETELPDHGGR